MPLLRAVCLPPGGSTPERGREQPPRDVGGRRAAAARPALADEVQEPRVVKKFEFR